MSHYTRGREFVRCAYRDLDDAETLLEKKSYQNAIYHFQQAVEKAQKADLIYSSTVNPLWDDRFILKWGHDLEKLNRQVEFSYNLFWSAIDEKPFSEFTNLDLEPRLRNNTLDQIKIDLNSGFLTYDDIARLSSPVICSILERSDLIVDVHRSLLDHIFFKSITAQSNFDEIRELWRDRIEAFDSLRIASFLDYATILAMPHSNAPRYPYDNHYHLLGAEEYTESLGIVRMMPQLLKRCRPVLEILYSEYDIVVRDHNETISMPKKEALSKRRELKTRLIRAFDYV